jgi:hypothetical protein
MKHSNHRLHDLRSWARPTRSPLPEVEHDENDGVLHYSIADGARHTHHGHTIAAPKIAHTHGSGTDVINIGPVVVPKVVRPPDYGTDVFVGASPFQPTNVVIGPTDPVAPTKVVPAHRDMGTDIFVDGVPYVPPATPVKVGSGDVSPGPAATGQTLICVYEPQPSHKPDTWPLQVTATKGPDAPIHAVLADLVQTLISVFEPGHTAKADHFEFADSDSAEPLRQGSGEGDVSGAYMGDDTEMPDTPGADWSNSDGWNIAYQDLRGAEMSETDYFHFV